MNTTPTGATVRVRNTTVRVLLAEDDPNTRWAMSTLLKRLGFEVRTACDGGEALELVREFAPQVILMDLMMPGIDGPEATHRLKSDVSTRSIPILVLTADDTPAGRARAEQAGCDDFLSKPIVFDDLVRRIRWHAALRRTSPGEGTSQRSAGG